MRDPQDEGPYSDLEFGPFRLDARGRVLYRDGQRVALSPKAFDLLHRLLLARGEVVSREELLQDLWPDVVVEEANVAKLVFQVRDVLGDVSELASAIETVPKRGYRFVAPVRSLERTARVPRGIDGQPRTDFPARPDSPPRRRTRRRVALGAVMLIGAAAALGLVLVSRPSDPGRMGPDRRSIAVLPFRNLGTDPADVYLGEGLAEDIVTHLATIPGLHVVSQASTARLQRSPASLETIGAELGVGSVVEGTVRREGRRVRITVELTDVRTGQHRWAEAYDRDLQNVLDVQADVSNRVAAGLSLRTGPAATLDRGGTRDAAAYDLYLRALSAMNQWVEGDNLSAAVQYLHAALVRDERFASAHALLAQAHVREGAHSNDDAWTQEAGKEASRALELEPRLALPHVVRGNVLFSGPGGWDGEGAIREFLRAIELDPSIGHLELAAVFAYHGLEKPAIRELDIAVSFDPLGDWTRDYALLISAMLGRWEEVLTRAKAWFPDDLVMNRPGWRAAIRLGQAKEILQELNLHEADVRPNQRILVEAASGASAERLDHLIAEFRPRAKPHSLTWRFRTYDLACAEALAGHRTAAMEWLRATVEGGLPAYLAFERDPFLASLREDPEYRTLMADLRARWEQWRSRYP